MKAQTISIVGLDRIGASIALAIKASSLQMTVLGHDRDNEVARRAQQMKIIDKADWSLSGAAAAADILVLSVPAHELEATLPTIGRDIKGHTLILDLSPLKGLGQKLARQHLKQGHYVGAVPVLAARWLADGRSGLDAARADLFRNSVFGLMPGPKAEPKAVETAVHVGNLLGATPFFLDPLEYDSLVQGVETVPGLLAAAMFRAVAQSTAWHDILRFAGLPFSLMTAALGQEADIPYLALHNQAATLRWLDALMEELRQTRRLVAQGDREQLAAMAELLSHDRQLWLKERAENDWDEKEIPGLEDVSSGFDLMGNLGRLRKKDKEE